MTDIVIPYRRSRSEELKYTLRSLKNIKHRNVYVIGDRSDYRVRHIPYKHGADIAKNSLDILKIACEHPEISKDFIWWHDDMMLLKPINQLPVFHMGTYDEILKVLPPFNFYTRMKQATNHKLNSQGIENPLFFDIHYPFVFNKDKVLAIVDKLYGVNKISFYANYYGIKGEKVDHDFKIRNNEPIQSDTFVSTHEASFGITKAGQYIRSLLDEPSEYESKPIVHMIWLGSDLPQAYRKNIQSYEKLGYTVKLWTKSPKMKNKELFDSAKTYALKADIMRLEILYQFGGLYTDTDSRMLGELPIESDLVCMTSASGYIANETIYATKNHPALKEAIDNLQDNVDRLRGTECNIWDIAGATYITPIFTKYPHVKLDHSQIGSRRNRPSFIEHQYRGSWTGGLPKSLKRNLGEWI